MEGDMWIRGLIVGLGVVALGAGSAGAQSVGTVAFSFRSLSVNLTLSEARRAGLLGRCDDRSLNELHYSVCTPSQRFWAEEVAGLEMYSPAISLDERGLLGFRFAVIQSGYETLKSAFVERYGPSCETKHDALQNRYGAQWQQETSVWCFADGRLRLSRYLEANVERSEAEFVSARMLSHSTNRPLANF